MTAADEHPAYEVDPEATVPKESRFETDPDVALAGVSHDLPAGWGWRRAEPDDGPEVLALLRAHEEAGRGHASAGPEDVEVELSRRGLRMRENVLVVDAEGRARGWGSVHDRSIGRMLLVVVPDRTLEPGPRRAVCAVLFAWARAQARELGHGRGLEVQQIDTGAFAADEEFRAELRAGGFEHVRTWWQMSRPVTAEDAGLVPDPTGWSIDAGARIRQLERGPDGMPPEEDLRGMHDVLESAFLDHFNSTPESFAEWLHRLREDPGHRWDHWWLAELAEDGDSGVWQPVGGLAGTLSEGEGDEPDGSYVSYIGVTEAARGRGVAKGLLHTIIADAAVSGRNRVGLEVDADSPTGADRLYRGLGWETSYETESWHTFTGLGEDG
ncbi:GNAT family N-acetyltransferase [Nocardioidaceae bacterium]|nr:GNAT family N-acetyltransferase [Nocardioidaceae bacterium]